MIARMMQAMLVGTALLLTQIAATGVVILTSIPARADEPFVIRYLPGSPCTFNGRPCGPTIVQSGAGQNCLGGGGNLTFEPAVACWAPGNVKLPKTATLRKLTDADKSAIESCVKSRMSVAFKNGKMACVPTPDEVTKKASALGSGGNGTQRIGPPGTGGGDSLACPPNCLKK